MSLGKKDIIKDISAKAHISSKSSHKFLTKLIDLIVSESFLSSVKISKFGTFYMHISPKRIGRNPKTKEEYIIEKRSKLALKVSQNIKDLLN